MRRIFLMSSVLFVAPFTFGETGEVSAQCVATTDCASLGYTETSCPNGGIKCPFGNTWSCKGAGGSDSGNGNSPDYGSKYDNENCTYGSIYYNDGVCIKELTAGRIPIGVIVYHDPVNGEKWITSLKSIGSTKWLSDHIDIPEITNHPSKSAALISEVKSCENTDALIKNGQSDAAKAVRNYSPDHASNTKGKWCLPAAGIFNMIINHKTAIDEALQKVGGLRFAQDCGGSGYGNGYWTSSEADKASAWTYDLDNKNFQTVYKNGYNPPYGYSIADFCIRPVMKI